MIFPDYHVHTEAKDRTQVDFVIPVSGDPCEPSFYSALFLDKRSAAGVSVSEDVVAVCEGPMSSAARSQVNPNSLPFLHPSLILGIWTIRSTLRSDTVHRGQSHCSSLALHRGHGPG